MNVSRKSLLLAAAAALLGAAAIPVAPGHAEAAGSDRLIRRCSAQGAGDISMNADWEVRGARKKFSVEFEAAPGGNFVAGQRVAFAVAGTVVAVDRLEAVVGGDLLGEVNFDTQAGANDPDEDPFPSNFPANVGSGTRVAVRSAGALVLACTLR